MVPKKSLVKRRTPALTGDHSEDWPLSTSLVTCFAVNFPKTDGEAFSNKRRIL